MIIEEMVEDHVRHYSDAGFKIRQVETGIVYDDAVDVVPCRYTYEETDEPIEDNAEEVTAQEALDIILGNENSETGEEE